MPSAVTPFTLNIPQSALDDLKTRLAKTRWPDAETADGWLQGVPLERAKDLIDYWAWRYDWRRCEAMLNGFSQYRTEIDGLGIYFLHIRSPHHNAMPVLLTHGWPGSVIEFHKVIGPLSDPVAHGGAAADAFHLIIPSLPGYGFSDKPKHQGWNIDRIASAWTELMRRLGYTRYVAQGGDWGSAVTKAMARRKPEGLLGLHLNMVAVKPGPLGASPTNEEKDALDSNRFYKTTQSGYAAQQSTKPQTLGYGLADSPAGQAMWIYEKFQSWTDCNGDPETILSRDEILDDVMLYWLPNTAASSARLYWESFGISDQSMIDLPVGCSIFPKELARAPRHWAETIFSKIIYWNRLERGGHFAAFEQPALFVEELRACFRLLR